MRIRYEKAAVKYLKGLQQSQRNSILTAIEKLTHHPAEGDIKPTSGYRDGRYRLRVGKYRVIYKYLNEQDIEILCVMDIGSRGDIYKKHSQIKEVSHDTNDQTNCEYAGNAS